MSSIFSDEERKESLAKKKYFREHPEEAKREYARTHNEEFGCIIIPKKEEGVKIVTCPLLNKEVEQNHECYDIAMVAEGGCPETFAPKEAMQKENWRDICNNCPNHLD